MKSALICLFSVISVIFLIASCDPNKVTDEYHTISNAKWSADSAEVFTFQILRKGQIHNIYFNIRNDQTYPFSNLWLFVTIQPPVGASKTDTVQVVLAEPSGKWIGKGFSGIYDNRMLYLKGVFFPEPGTYTIYLRHGMRPALLKGIADIGIRVEKVY
jgi:gliding motility-associated lipoprotein GldH